MSNPVIENMKSRRSCRAFKKGMGNLMLAAHSLGVDSIWIHRAKEEFESEEGKALLKALGIEGDWDGIGHCALGYAAGPLPAGAPRKPGRVVWA